VRARTRLVNVAKALVRRDGLRLPSGMVEHVPRRITELAPPPLLAAELLPLTAILTPLTAEIAAADERITRLGRIDGIITLLATAPGIGLLTASAIVAVADDIARFPSAHHFEAYLGLVPGERSSGDKRAVGRITKAGNSRARYLLVEAAWRIMRSPRDDTAALRAWATRIALRRGKRIAVVALARRLAGITYAMWRDNAPYDGARIRMPHTNTE
jgi:transposase